MAAVGDVTSEIMHIHGTGTVTDQIQPAAGNEWVIHNIYAGGACEVYLKDATYSIKFYTLLAAGWITGVFCHVNNTTYIEIKNTSGADTEYAYDGVVTKAA